MIKQHLHIFSIKFIEIVMRYVHNTKTEHISILVRTSKALQIFICAYLFD